MDCFAFCLEGKDAMAKLFSQSFVEKRTSGTRTEADTCVCDTLVAKMLISLSRGRPFFIVKVVDHVVVHETSP